MCASDGWVAAFGVVEGANTAASAGVPTMDVVGHICAGAGANTAAQPPLRASAIIKSAAEDPVCFSACGAGLCAWDSEEGAVEARAWAIGAADGGAARGDDRGDDFGLSRLGLLPREKSPPRFFSVVEGPAGVLALSAKGMAAED